MLLSAVMTKNLKEKKMNTDTKQQTAVQVKEEVKKESKQNRIKPELKILTDFPLRNMVEEGKSIKITMELPGISKNEIKINYNIKSVTISGKKKFVLSKTDGNLIISEPKYGTFTRYIDLPCDVNVSKKTVKASINKGLFMLKLKKKNYNKLKTVPVK